MSHTWRLAGVLGATLLAAACRPSDPDAPARPADGGGGNVSSDGGNASSASQGGGGMGEGGSPNLGWPLDDALPERCPPASPAGGNNWDGWANLQHPPVIEVATGTETPAIYGRTYHALDTPASGQAPGWEAELAIGPLGTVPTGEGRCWTHFPAAFNVDVGNDDEYAATLTPDAPGLFGLFYRFRPPGGAWRYGDLDGSDDGISAGQASMLWVTSTSTDRPLVVATVNLRCRLDDWPARKPLVIAALARVDPDLIAFQEDCIEAGGPSQAEEVRTQLATYTKRGYALRRAGTHLADGTYDEGVSILSALPVATSREIDLPFVAIPRKALVVDVVARGRPIRFYATHFDFGDAAEDARGEAAAAILDDLATATHGIVAGDLNADPEEPAIGSLGAELIDLWSAANPTAAGLTFPASSPTTRIDYAFASPALADGIAGAKLLDEAEGGTLLSDHLGVAVAVSLP